jgi:hypothetical protein
VDEGRTEDGREAQVDRDSLLEAKDETISILRDQLRLRAEEIQRRDVIISQITQATSNLTDPLRELEASVQEPAPSENREKAAQAPAESQPDRAGWWRPSERL